MPGSKYAPIGYVARALESAEEGLVRGHVAKAAASPAEMAAREIVDSDLVSAGKKLRGDQASKVLKQVVSIMEKFFERTRLLPGAGSKAAIEKEIKLFLKELQTLPGKIEKTVVKTAQFSRRRIIADPILRRVLGKRLGGVATLPVVERLLTDFNAVSLPEGPKTLKDIARRVLELVPSGKAGPVDSAVRNKVDAFLRNEFGKAREAFKRNLFREMERDPVLAQRLNEAHLGLAPYKSGETGKQGYFFYFDVQMERVRNPGSNVEVWLPIDIDHAQVGFAEARDAFLRTGDPEMLRPIFDANALQFLEASENRVFIEKIRSNEDIAKFHAGQPLASVMQSLPDAQAREQALRSIDTVLDKKEQIEKLSSIIDEYKNDKSLSEQDRETLDWLTSLVDPFF